jgi:hypothetical protein
LSGGAYIPEAGLARDMVKEVVYYKETFRSTGWQRWFSVATGKLIFLIPTSGSAAEVVYDVSGNPVRIATGNNPTDTTYFNWSGGRLNQLYDFAARTSSLSYSSDNLVTVTAPGCCNGSFTYDAAHAPSSSTTATSSVNA